MRQHARIAGAGAVLLCIALLWAYPLLSLKLAAQFDTTVHLRWLTQFHASLQNGWWLPRWAYASLDGLGDPTFFYYQPLAYYATSAFLWMGADSGHALVLAEILPYLLLGAIVFQRILRAYPGRVAALGTAFVLACPPLYFLATQMTALPWVFGFPFAVLFVTESIRERPRALLLAVLICLTCLGHLLTGMMVLLAVGLARLLFALPNRHSLAAHLRWGGGVALGLALSAFFLYPAITQLGLITPSGWSASFDWRRGFVFPLVTWWRHGLLWVGPQIPFPLLALGLAGLTLWPAPATARSPAQTGARRLAIVALVALAFGSELAYPLYARFDALQKLQFPYRFMFLATVLAAIAFVIHLNEGAWSRWSRATRALAVLLAGLYLAQTGILQWKLLSAGARLPEPSVYMSGRFGQPEYLPAVHGPHWTNYIAHGGMSGECHALGVGCRVTSVPGQALAVTVDGGREVALRLPLFAFPAWRVNVDGVPQEVSVDADTGLLLARVGPGQHEVTLQWQRLPAEIAGLWISAGALCLMLGGILGGLLAPAWRRRHGWNGALAAVRRLGARDPLADPDDDRTTPMA